MGKKFETCITNELKQQLKYYIAKKKKRTSWSCCVLLNCVLTVSENANGSFTEQEVKKDYMHQVKQKNVFLIKIR